MLDGAREGRSDAEVEALVRGGQELSGDKAPGGGSLGPGIPPRNRKQKGEPKLDLSKKLAFAPIIFNVIFLKNKKCVWKK